MFIISSRYLIYFKKGGSLSNSRLIPKSEIFMIKALNELKEEGLIVDFVHAARNGQMDKEGIDSLIFLKHGFTIPFQVKLFNERNGKKDLRKEHYDKHPNVKAFLYVIDKNYEKKTVKLLKTKLKILIKKSIKEFIKEYK